MPSLVEVLGLRNGFSDDLAYLAFCQEHLLPSLAGIAVAVGKDILWKPMNHKVLLLCRDKRKSVRLAALSALKFFFQEVFIHASLSIPSFYLHRYVIHFCLLRRLARNTWLCCLSVFHSCPSCWRMTPTRWRPWLRR